MSAAALLRSSGVLGRALLRPGAGAPAAAPARGLRAAARRAAAAAARPGALAAAREASVPTTARAKSGMAEEADPWGGKTPAHGGVLVNTVVSDAAERQKLIASCAETVELSDRNACDVELLTVGGFSPLDGFLSQADYDSVVADMRLKNGLLFGLPIVLDTDSESIQPGMNLLLRYQGTDMAVMEVTDKYTPNKALEAKQCYGVSTIEHPGVHMISTERGKYYLGGKVHGLDLPTRPFPCATPEEVRAGLPAGADVVAFQCRNPVHRAHYELFIRSRDAPNVDDGAVVLVHPTCGPTQGDDIPGDVRYKTYEVLKSELKDDTIQWAYLPYSMHMAGPREALQHMLIRKNYGCTHFIIGRDMAGSKSSLDGEDFYGAYDAQDLAKSISEELGVQCVPSQNVMYTEEKGYVTADVAEAEGLTPKKLSGTKFRKMLRAGEDIPEWFAFKSVVQVLRDAQK